MVAALCEARWSRLSVALGRRGWTPEESIPFASKIRNPTTDLGVATEGRYFAKISGKIFAKIEWKRYKQKRKTKKQETSCAL